MRDHMERLTRKSVLVALILVFSISGNASAEDAEDEAAQESEAEGGNFVPLPIFITEPAVGEGLGAGLIYFHATPPDERPKLTTGKELKRVGRRAKPPPTASGVFAAYTNNDTWGAGFGHARTWSEDTYRFVGAIAALNVNAAVFAGDIPFSFNIEGNLIYSSIKRRLFGSDVFLGVSASSLDADVTFNIGGGETPPAELFDFDFQTNGLALSLLYDARDDTMMPSKGLMVDLTGWWYDEAVGSDFDYTSYRLKIHSFHQLHEKFVLGLRFDGATVNGDPPFFAVPFVSLRGIPALRYQGDSAGVIEVEGRYTFADRWAAVAFAGAGYTDEIEPIFATDNNIRAGGVGIRYQALRSQNVWLGLDLAWGPEDEAWYIQMGHPW
jgi:hypothetical protein